MLIFEAKSQLQERVDLWEAKDKEPIKDYISALEMGVKALDAQQRLCDMLNDFWADVKESDGFSAKLVYEILESLTLDYKGEEE